MKRLVMGIAACALILASCTKNEVVESIDHNSSQYKFGVIAGTATKATEKIGFTTGESVSLWARSLNAEPYSFNETLTKVADGWETGIPRFAPAEGKVDFLAIWPKDAVATDDLDYTAGIYSFSYTVKDNTSEETAQKDLIGGVLSDATGGGLKTINLRHLLSQINFGVYGYKGAQIKITDIKVWAVNNTGIYTLDGGTNMAGTWSEVAGSKDYEYTNAGEIVPAMANIGDKYIFGDGGKWAVGTDAFYWNENKNGGAGWDNPQSITEENNPQNALMLMPQLLVEGKTTAAYATFSYEIRETGNNGNLIKKETNARFDLKTDAVEEWSPNYRYVYMIDFSGFLRGQSLSFNVDVDVWENYDGNGGTVDYPVNNINATIFNPNNNTLTIHNSLGVAIATVSPIIADDKNLTIGDSHGRVIITGNTSGVIDLSGIISNGYCITKIENNAFSSSALGITSVILPPTLQTIGKNAFMNCTTLASIDIPTSVTSIDDFAFSGCTSLVEVYLHEGLTSVGKYLFSGCTALTTVNIPTGEINISEGMFNGCTLLASITLHEGLESIGYIAFQNCISLTEVTLPASLITIEAAAFYNCSALALITCLGTTEPNIGNIAFFGGPALLRVLQVPLSGIGNFTLGLWGAVSIQAIP